MEIKLLISIFFFFYLSQTWSLSSSLVSCRDLEGASVLNSYTEYEFNDEGTKLINKTIKKGPIVRHWSNLSDKIHEVFYKYSNQKFKSDRVQVSYIEDKTKKELRNKIYNLVKAKGNEYKMANFHFSDGVTSSDKRPGKQHYTFMNGDKPICSIIIEHSESAEDPQ